MTLLTQNLSNILEAPIRAGDKFIWFFSDGRIAINSPYMVNNEVKRNENDPGKFNIFYPKK